MQMTVRLSFKRDGEMFGQPRLTYATPGNSIDTRKTYRDAIDAALARCTPLTVTKGLGGAIAGRPNGSPLPSTTAANNKAHNKDSTMTSTTTRSFSRPPRNVTIAMRPDLAPDHVARITGTGPRGLLRRHRFSPGDRRVHGANRLPAGHRHRRFGQKLKAEFNKEKHVRGTVSMARAASPDSGDSQFFICFADAPFLNGQYTVWGTVTDGMENVDKIKRGEPVINPDKILKAQIKS